MLSISSRKTAQWLDVDYRDAATLRLGSLLTLLSRGVMASWTDDQKNKSENDPEWAMRGKYGYRDVGTAELRENVAKFHRQENVNNVPY